LRPVMSRRRVGWTSRRRAMSVRGCTFARRPAPAGTTGSAPECPPEAGWGGRRGGSPEVGVPRQGLSSGVSSEAQSPPVAGRCEGQKQRWVEDQWSGARTNCGRKARWWPVHLPDGWWPAETGGSEASLVDYFSTKRTAVVVASNRQQLAAALKCQHNSQQRPPGFHIHTGLDPSLSFPHFWILNRRTSNN
jgi:hypothetical protein